MNPRAGVRFLAAGVLALPLAACATRPSSPGLAGPGAVDVPASAAPSLPTPRTEVAGHSHEGRPLEYRVWGHGRVPVMIMATIHGDEPAGTPLVRTLEEVLARRPHLLDERTVILVPVVNPDGMAARSRGNSRRVDLNRNFPAANFGASSKHGPAPLSEPESRAIAELIRRYRPERIVSIHQPLRCVDWDGPGRQLAAAMGANSDLPVRKLGGRPGSLGSFAGLDLGIPVITLELPGGAERHDASVLWDRYGGLLLTAIRHPPAYRAARQGQVLAGE